MSRIDNIIDLGFEESIVFSNPNYETAITGVSLDGRVIYDYEKMIKYLMDTDNMTYEDAVEWIDYNIFGYPLNNDLRPIVAYCFNDEDD